MDKIKKLIELIEFEYGDCNCDSEKKCSFCKIIEKIKEIDIEKQSYKIAYKSNQEAALMSAILSDKNRCLEAKNKKLKDALENCLIMSPLDPFERGDMIREALKEVSEK